MQDHQYTLQEHENLKNKDRQIEETGTSIQFYKNENENMSDCQELQLSHDLSVSTIHVEHNTGKQEDTLHEGLTIGPVIDQDLENSKAYQHRINTSLAYAMVQRYPPKIKQQMEKVIQYYEKTIFDQERAYKKLLIQKNMIKNLVKNTSYLHQQENYHLQQSVSASDLDKQNRLDELQKKLIEKNQQINGLNQQITQLLVKNKKYKKKLKQTEKNTSKTDKNQQILTNDDQKL